MSLRYGGVAAGLLGKPCRSTYFYAVAYAEKRADKA
jgi:hypothetical protein